MSSRVDDADCGAALSFAFAPVQRWTTQTPPKKLEIQIRSFSGMLLHFREQPPKPSFGFLVKPSAARNVPIQLLLSLGRPTIYCQGKCIGDGVLSKVIKAQSRAAREIVPNPFEGGWQISNGLHTRPNFSGLRYRPWYHASRPIANVIRNVFRRRFASKSDRPADIAGRLKGANRREALDPDEVQGFINSTALAHALSYASPIGTKSGLNQYQWAPAFSYNLSSSSENERAIMGQSPTRPWVSWKLS